MSARIKSSLFRRTSNPRRSLLRVESLEHRAVPATFMVTNTGDNGGVNPAAGAATGTFRQAIVDAGASAGEDDIKFDAAAFANAMTITLEGNLPTIKNGRLTISGPGVHRLTINGGGTFSLLANDVTAKNFQVSDMTLTGGAGSFGGAITVDPKTEAFTLIRAKVTGNTGLKAGAIYANQELGYSSVIVDSIISNNTGPTGGILSTGQGPFLSIQNSTISGNTGTSNDAKAGGGVAFTPLRGNNTGIYYGGFRALNTTIHGNSTLNKNGGGGILHSAARLSTQNYLMYSTVTGNASPTDSSGAGGVSVTGRYSQFNMFSSVIAQNIGSAVSPDLSGIIKNYAGMSFIGVRPIAAFEDDGMTLSGDPKLGPLQDNGGPTPTRMPNADSPLLDSGDLIVYTNGVPVTTTDQRGSPRTVNGNEDIGAVEHPVGDTTKPNVTIQIAPNQTSPETDDTIEFAVQFDQNVEDFDETGIDLTGSAVGGTLVATVVPVTGSSYIVQVKGMSGLGDVVASVKAGAAKDGGGNLSNASTGSNNVVGFNGVGRISFKVEKLETGEGKGVVITAVRTGQGLGTASAGLELVAGTANAADVAPTAGLFEWAAGQLGEKSVTIAINDDAKNEGVESFMLKLANPAGSAAAPTLALGGLTVTIDRSDATPVDASHKLLFKDEDGDKVTVKYGGYGTANFYINDSDDDGQGTIDFIDVLNSDEKSTLTVSVAKVGDGLVDLGTVRGRSLKSINAAKSNLVGEGVRLTGYLATLSLNSISNGADIEADGEMTLKTKITVKGAIGDGTDITISNVLSSLTAASFADTDAEVDIFADSIGTMTINGNFGGEIEVTGDGVDHAKGKNSIGSINVKGAMNGSDIRVTGNVGSVSVYDFVNSHLYGGYQNGAFGATKTTIGSFKTAANKKLGMTGKFENSSIYADTVKKATLASVTSNNNGAPIGLLLDTEYYSVTFTINGTKSTTKNSADFPAVGDFDVNII